jgi:hypothetical protein
MTVPIIVPQVNLPGKRRSLVQHPGAGNAGYGSERKYLDGETTLGETRDGVRVHMSPGSEGISPS